jgi:hypothetical protein
MFRPLLSLAQYSFRHYARRYHYTLGNLPNTVLGTMLVGESRRHRSNSDACALCHNVQTNKHVLSNCSSEVALNRYTSRHDAVLAILAKWLFDSIINTSGACNLYVDLPASSYNSLSDLFRSLRPDIALVYMQSIIILELTVCHESNLIKSREFKLNKYLNLKSDLNERFLNYPVKIFTIEVSTLGFISNIDDFAKSVAIPKLPTSVKSLITSTVLPITKMIYFNRNNNCNYVN